MQYEEERDLSPTELKEKFSLSLRKIPDLGFEQRSQYHQPDLWHEEVVELSSPFASVVLSETKTYTFLILGDQNAGKSTFIHAFTYDRDPNFLSLSSSLPILSSAFLNSRFINLNLEQQDGVSNEGESEVMRKIRDEPPFIDTDLARGNFLLTAEDFRFFLEEHQLASLVNDVGIDVRFVVVQFVEIGGDHLDSLMKLDHEREQHTNDASDAKKSTSASHSHDHDHDELSPWLVGILDRTSQLLKEAKKTIYFINASTLFSEDDRSEGSDSLKVNQSSLKMLISRVRYLDRSLSVDGHDIMFYISRFPVGRKVSLTREDLELVGGSKKRKTTTSSSTHSVEEAVRILLEYAKTTQLWKLEISGIYQTNHLNDRNTINDPVRGEDEMEEDEDEEGSINVKEVMKTLARLFSKQMTSNSDNRFVAECLTIEYLIDCHSHMKKVKLVGESLIDRKLSAVNLPEEQWKEVEAEQIALTKEEFWDYLEELEFCEIPHTTALQKYDIVIMKLIEHHFALPLKASDFGEHTRLNIDFQLPSTTRKKSLGSVATSTDVCLRCPLYPPLMSFVKKCLSGTGTTSRIPNEFWSSTSSISLNWVPAQLLPELTKAIRDLETLVQLAWQLTCNDTTNTTKQVSYDLALWLLEDWCLATRLEAALSSSSSPQIESDQSYLLEFPLTIEVSSHKSWSKFEESLNLSIGETETTTTIQPTQMPVSDDSPIIVQRSSASTSTQEQSSTRLRFEIPTVTLKFAFK